MDQMQQLAQIEHLCHIMYGGTEPANMKDAQMQLLQLQSSAEFIPQCQFILDNTKLHYAQVLAASSLETLMSKFWNNFTVDQKWEVRNYFVLTALIKLICKITSLGWFDGPEFRDIIDDVTKFVECGPDHTIIGLKILTTMIEEMNIQNPNRTLTQHRKAAVSFRDQSLYAAFQLSITNLRTIMSGVGAPQNQHKLTLCALKLASQCLSFDFIGTNPEESGEDIGTVQVPTAWRPSLIQLSSEENYHEYCRLLGRLKTSYQLSELVRVPNFSQNWAEKMNSIHYCLALWSRMVAALPYLRSDDRNSVNGVHAQTLKNCVNQVVQAYIQTMLDSVTVVVQEQGGVEDPLDDEGSLREALDRLPGVARLQYDTISQYLTANFNELLQNYESITFLSPKDRSQNEAQVQIVLGKLTWLTYIIEVAILQFLKAFKKAFMSDYSVASSTSYSSSVASNGVDSNFIMKVLVEKLCTNIKHWHTDDDILTETLEVFVDFVSTYSGGKTLLGLEAVHFMVYNHTGQHFPEARVAIVGALQTLYDDPNVINTLLKFMKEFVQNRGQRIYFEQSSANGILLFRETSNILCSYGSRILNVPVVENVYKEKYKGIRVLLDTITHALSGNYNLLDVSLQLCLTIPLDDVMAYTKLCKAYFSFLEVLFRHHLDVLAGLESTVFIELIKKVNEGLHCGDTNVICVCAMSLDHIASYIFLNQNRGQNKPTCLRIRQHVTSEPTMMSVVMNSLFTTLLFASAASCWPLTRPILSVMLSFPDSFQTYKEQLINSQNAENVYKLQTEFENLLKDLQHSLDSTQRDKFTSKLTAFRLQVRSFLNI
eukprot:GSChrysophyteH1.ASY1.ANO1.2881.1 assembled CDS